jgi:hypothetical protein
MLTARGVSRPGAKLRVLDPKHITTLKDNVLSYKFWQCPVLQRVFLGKNAFLGLALNILTFIFSAIPSLPILLNILAMALI